LLRLGGIPITRPFGVPLSINLLGPPHPYPTGALGRSLGYTGEGTPVEAKERMGSLSKKRSAKGMHVCQNCDSILVQPVSWLEQGDGHWHVELRCPECGLWGRDRYFQTDVDAYDEELDRGGRGLLADLRFLTLANMTEEADRFAAALATDGILPEDFNAGGRLTCTD
jgi:hypothetical protein